jgi:hypothetical protein
MEKRQWKHHVPLPCKRLRKILIVNKKCQLIPGLGGKSECYNFQIPANSFRSRSSSQEDSLLQRLNRDQVQISRQVNFIGCRVWPWIPIVITHPGTLGTQQTSKVRLIMKEITMF